MADWSSRNIMLTTKGAAAISKVQSGSGKLTITKVVASEQYVSESTLREVTSLSVENLPLTIVDRHEVPDGGSVIQVQLNNLDLDNPFVFNEIGVFATHSDNPSEEFLYIIAQVDADTGDRIPLYSTTPITATYDIYLYNVGADNVEVTISSSGLVTYEALNEACGMIKRSTSYTQGDIKYSSSLPIPYYLKCKVAGTTSSSSLVVPSDIEEGDTITDGTVVWEVIKLVSSDELQTRNWDTFNAEVITPPSESTQNSIGASDRPWHEGHFESVKLNGGDLGEYLAESTGYGIVSGCEPTISGLTVTVGAGVVHLADGTRKEISASTVTLDAADSTNPRIDLVYFDSTGAVAKITGTAAASPSAPTLPTNGISVAQVSVAVGATTGTVTDSRDFALITNKNVMTVKEGHFDKLVADEITAGKVTADEVDNKDKVQFLFPKTTRLRQQGDCQIIVTPEKTMMIDSDQYKETLAETQEQYNYIIEYLKSHNIRKIDIFLLTHYHGDHYGNIPAFLAQDEIDFSECEWLIPSNAVSTSTKNTVIGYFTSTNTPYRELSEDETIQLSNNCYVDLMCCNSDIEDYISEVGVDVSNENPRSIYALVRHGNVNVLYAGDGYYPETEFVRTTYNLPKVNLLKIPHHGVSSRYNVGASIAFFKEISPDYAVFNHGWNHFDSDVGDYYLFGENTRYYQQFATVVGAKVFHLSKDAEFISDRESLIHVSNNYPIKSFYNSAPIAFYVDANATEIPDGTKEKPFKSINAAIQSLPVNASEVQVNIIIKPAEYNSLVLTNFHGQINFKKYEDGDITIKRVLFSNCSDITTSFTNLTVEQLIITKSNVTMGGNVIVTPDDTRSLEYKNLEGVNYPEINYAGSDIFPVIIAGSKIHFYKLIIDGQSLTSAYGKKKIVHILNTTMSIRLLAIQNVLSTLNVEYIFDLDRNSIVDVSEIDTLENVYCPLFNVTFGALFRLEKTSDTAITSNTFTASSIFTTYLYSSYPHNLKAMTYNYPGPSIGATTYRPNSKIVAYGNTYYDTTLGHLLIWTGSKWRDCTTNAVIN